MTMGMSTHVVGFKPPDEKWQRMKAVWDACEAAGTGIPDDVLKYFNHEEPDEAGVEVSEEDLEAAGAVVEYNDGQAQSGYEIQIDNVPKDVKLIRVYNAW